MRDNTKKKAPRVEPPNKKKPNFMREADKIKDKVNPMSKKRLSK